MRRCPDFMGVVLVLGVASVAINMWIPSWAVVCTPQGESKLRSGPHAAFHANLATVCFDDLFCDGQAKARPRALPLAGDTKESLKHVCEILLRNPRTAVLH